MFSVKRTLPVLLFAVLCAGVFVSSNYGFGESHSLSTAAQSMAVGGSDCSDFSDFEVGLGIAAIFRCLLCAVGAAGAKLLASVC